MRVATCVEIKRKNVKMNGQNPAPLLAGLIVAHAAVIWILAHVVEPVADQDYWRRHEFALRLCCLPTAAIIFRNCVCCCRRRCLDLFEPFCVWRCPAARETPALEETLQLDALVVGLLLHGLVAAPLLVVGDHL